MNSPSLPGRPDDGNRNRFARHPALTGMILLLAGAVILEGALRLADPPALEFAYSLRRVLRYHDRWYTDFEAATSTTIRLRDSRGDYVLDFPVTINGDGFRVGDAPPDRAPRSSRPRYIHAIGDSYTMGWGVSYASSYPALLEELLPRHFRVLNLGLAGYGTIGATEKSLLLLDRSPPVAVVYLFTGNDYEDDERALWYARWPAVVHRGLDLFNWFRRHTYSANLLHALRSHLRFREGGERKRKAGRDEPEELGAAPAPPDDGAGRASKEALRRYARVLRERDVALLVLTHDDGEAERDLLPFCRRNGIESHRRLASRKLRRPDGHFNRLGNEEMAHFVAGLLERRGVVTGAAARNAARTPRPEHGT
jgi:lysophospholipase L1-like esterase